MAAATKVMRPTLEEQWLAAVDVDILVDVAVDVTCAGTSKWCRGMGSGPRGVLAVLPLPAISLTVLFLYRDLLRSLLRVARSLLSECSVEIHYLLVELVSGLGEFIEAHPALGVCDAVMWCWLCVRGAAHAR